MFEENNLLKEEKTTIAVTPETAKKTTFSITEAARLNNVTRQAIYVAIKQKKLVAAKKDGRWTIELKDLEQYRKNKYSRSKSTYEGELIFDNSKGLYSVNQVARILKVPAQKIYYAIRVGQVKTSRKGAAWIINKQDMEEYRQKYLSGSFFGVEAG